MEPARNILHIVYSLETGGLERMVVNLTNALAERRYNPFICCIKTAGDLAHLFAYPENILDLGHRGRITSRIVNSIKQFVRQNDICLIHSHNFPGLLYGFLPARLNRIPIVHTAHGYIPRGDPPLLRGIEHVFSRGVDRYVCVSQNLCELMQRRFALRTNACRLIYNGIPVADAPEMSARGRRESILIGSVGRLTHIKNYELLLRAFAKFSVSYPNARLEIIGEGEMRLDLERVIHELSLERSAFLRGQLLEVREALLRFDIFVLPSISEGHSIALLEALSTGTVCVASNVGGNPEIIENGVNGFLFPSGDAEALTERMRRVADALGTLEMDAIRSSAIRTVNRRFSLEAMTHQYDVLYREVLGKTPG